MTSLPLVVFPFHQPGLFFFYLKNLSVRSICQCWF